VTVELRKKEMENIFVTPHFFDRLRNNAAVHLETPFHKVRNSIMAAIKTGLLIDGGDIIKAKKCRRVVHF